MMRENKFACATLSSEIQFNSELSILSRSSVECKMCVPEPASWCWAVEIVVAPPPDFSESIMVGVGGALKPPAAQGQGGVRPPGKVRYPHQPPYFARWLGTSFAVPIADQATPIRLSNQVFTMGSSPIASSF